jgi:hypothetical protein
MYSVQGGEIEVGFLSEWEVVFMSTYDARLATLEKGVAVMKQDFTYKLDDINSALAILKGVTGEQGRDIKDIKGRLDGIDGRLDGIDRRFASMEEKFDKRFEQVDERFKQMDQRFKQMDQRFEKVNLHFEQVLRILATLANKAE